MDGWEWALLISAILILAVSAGLALVIWQRRHIRAAIAQFQPQREELAAEFLRSASATGKPRGLRWVACDWNDEFAYARDRKNGQLAAFVSVTIRFEAIEGGEMESVEAVGNLRYASAVFFFHQGRWRTAGRAVFNLGPREALEHLKGQFQRIPDRDRAGEPPTPRI
jgi:hypothetical protein